MVYEPQEDSYLLRTFVQRHAKGRVLDVGTGSGIQAITAYKMPSVKQVWAADIDPKSIAHCKKHHKQKIKWIISDLFLKLKDKKCFFDTIIFNPPYLPGKRHIDLEGGKKGYETIDRFLKEAPDYLKPDGTILLLFSSQTNKQHVLDTIQKQLLTAKELGKKRLFFEELYVYSIRKSKLITELSKKGISNIAYFAHGKRGIVYTGTYRCKKVGIKIKRKISKAQKTVQKEAKWVKGLNKYGIGPKYKFHTAQYLVYDFVEGKYLKDMIGKRIAPALRDVLDQCYKMDKLSINKEEMTRPLKNAIVKGNKAVLIDFERTHKIKEPHNVTQYCQFLYKCAKAFKLNRQRIKKLAKQYSDDKSKKNYLMIRKEIK